MTYTRVHADWQDDPSTATPILAADLEHMEDGIVEGAQDATEAQKGNVELASAAEMSTETDLTRPPSVKRVADYVNGKLAALPGTVAASETQAGVVELATAAELTTGTDLTRAPSVKRIADYVAAQLATLSASFTTSLNALSASVTASLANKADKGGSWNQFADVSNTAFTDGDVPMSTSGVMEPIDLSLNYAGLDANLRLDPANNPQFYIPIVVIEEGTTPPGTFPSYGLVGKLPAAASLIPTILHVNSARAANNVVLTFPSAVPAGAYVGFSIGFSSEAGIDHFSGAFGGTGAGAGTLDFGTLSIPNTTCGVLNGIVKLSTGAAAGSTLTFTARDVSNAAINRVHIIAAMYQDQNIAAVSARDQQGVTSGTGASSSTLTAVTAAAAAPTVQPSELVIGAAVISAGTSPNLRDITGTGIYAGNTLVNHLSDNGASGRRLLVVYSVLSAIATPALTTLVSLSGTATQTGQWAAKIDTFKGI